MTVHYVDDQVTVHAGDCLEVLTTLPDCSVDAVVTDPPYGIGFMGKEWDGTAIRAAAARDRETRTALGPESASRPGRAAARSSSAYGNEAIIAGPVRGGRDFQHWCEQWSAECLRVLKPGGHFASFGGSRTWHRLACAVEDAGFEIRDSMAWLYGSGFPKSHNVAKAIGESRCKARHDGSGRCTLPADHVGLTCRFARSGEQVEASDWEGWGTALKPAFEPIVLGRKPFPGTVAANVLEHGTGALNIDACRIGVEERINQPAGNKPGGASLNMSVVGMPQNAEPSLVVGRWPTNVLLDESQACALDEQTGILTSGGPGPDGPKRNQPPGNGIYGGGKGLWTTDGPAGQLYADSGGASRFFPTFRYEAKAPNSERPSVGGVAHPTVKPLDLMRWLVRLVTPPNGLVLDPFAGSGTTAEACIHEHMRCITIERETDYLPLIVARISKPIHVGFDFGT